MTGWLSSFDGARNGRMLVQLVRNVFTLGSAGCFIVGYVVGGGTEFEVFVKT